MRVAQRPLHQHEARQQTILKNQLTTQFSTSYLFTWLTLENFHQKATCAFCCAATYSTLCTVRECVFVISWHLKSNNIHLVKKKNLYITSKNPRSCTATYSTLCRVCECKFVISWHLKSNGIYNVPKNRRHHVCVAARPLIRHGAHQQSLWPARRKPCALPPPPLRSAP